VGIESDLTRVDSIVTLVQIHPDMIEPRAETLGNLDYPVQLMRRVQGVTGSGFEDLPRKIDPFRCMIRCKTGSVARGNCYALNDPHHAVKNEDFVLQGR
jgi:hypothetical protein